MADLWNMGPTPNTSPLQSMLDFKSKLAGMQAPTALATTGPYQQQGSAYQAKDYSGSLPQFDQMRNQAKQTQSQQAGANSDAMQRRFASMGNLNSGAYEKAAEMQDQKNNEAANSTTMGINAQEAQARMGLDQSEQNKVFQSGEALAGRNFQGQQAVDQRNLQTQEFNTQNQNQFNQMQLQGMGQIAGMDQQAKAQEWQQSNDQFNKELNMYNAKHSGGLFGGGGFLGIGIGV